MAVCRDCGAIEYKKEGWRGRRCRKCVAAAERNRYYSSQAKKNSTPPLSVQTKEQTNLKTKSTEEKVPSYYTDTGCSISNSCFECPLSVCRYDGKQGKIEYQKHMKNIKKNKRLEIALIK